MNESAKFCTECGKPALKGKKVDLKAVEKTLDTTGNSVYAIGWLTVFVSIAIYLWSVLDSGYASYGLPAPDLSGTVLMLGVSAIFIILGSRIKEGKDKKTKLYLQILVGLSLATFIWIIASGGNVGVLFIIVILYLISSLIAVGKALKSEEFTSSLVDKNRKINKKEWIIAAMIFVVIFLAAVAYDIAAQPLATASEAIVEEAINSDFDTSLTTSTTTAELIDKAGIKDIPRIESIARASPTTIPSAPEGYSVSEIVSGWQNRVAEVACFSKNGEDGGGAATLITTDEGVVAVTNDHVIDNGSGSFPDSCAVGIYGLGARVVGYAPGKFATQISNGLDLGFILLENPDYETDDGYFDIVASGYMPVCSEADVQIGDEIVILGYPWNGSQSSVTASRGIVSGFDDIYYVTDAKIEQGNSGGAAILMKKNCWLGIPTASLVGRVESFGRILKGEYAVE